MKSIKHIPEWLNRPILLMQSQTTTAARHAHTTTTQLTVPRWGPLGFLALLLLGLLSSCAPTKRACERNYGPCGQLDTVTVIEPVEVPVPRRSINTLFRVDTLAVHDTVIVEDEHVRTRYIRTGDTVLLSTDCKPDTIREPAKVYTITKQPSPDTGSGIKWYVWLAIGIAAASLVIILILKR